MLTDGTSSTTSSAFGSVERKDQLFLVVPFLAARLTWVAQSSVPLSFKWAMAPATVGNQRQSRLDTGHTQTPRMV